jgi:hypothetical protein
MILLRADAAMQVSVGRLDRTLGSAGWRALDEFSQRD